MEMYYLRVLFPLMTLSDADLSTNYVSMNTVTRELEVCLPLLLLYILTAGLMTTYLEC